MFYLLKLLWYLWSGIGQFAVAMIVLYFTIDYDKKKRKTEKEDEQLKTKNLQIERLKNEIIIVCEKLVIYGIHYEYRTLYANYLEAILNIEPHDALYELDRSMFLQNHEITETSLHNFYLCKPDLLKCKHELLILWEPDNERDELIKQINVVMLSNLNMNRGKYTWKNWKPEEKEELKEKYSNDAGNIQEVFFQSDLGKSISAILKLLSPEILSHLDGLV